MPSQLEPGRAVRGQLPGARGHPRLHRPYRSGPLRRGRGTHPQGQPLPQRMRLCMRASLRGDLPPHHGGRCREHPRHQALRRRPRDRPARDRPRPRHGQAHRHRGCRALGPHLRLLPRPHGPRGRRVRAAREGGRHAALRHPQLSPAQEHPRRRNRLHRGRRCRDSLQHPGGTRRHHPRRAPARLRRGLHRHGRARR